MRDRTMSEGTERIDRTGIETLPGYPGSNMNGTFLDLVTGSALVIAHTDDFYLGTISASTPSPHYIFSTPQALRRTT